MCPYVSRKYSYVTCMSSYVTRMYSYGFVCHSNVCTRTYLYVLVRTCMYSYVLVCIVMLLVCIRVVFYRSKPLHIQLIAELSMLTSLNYTASGHYLQPHKLYHIILHLGRGVASRDIPKNGCKGV